MNEDLYSQSLFDYNSFCLSWNMGSVRQQIIAILFGAAGFGPGSTVHYLEEYKPRMRSKPAQAARGQPTKAQRLSTNNGYIRFQHCGPWYSYMNYRWALESSVDPLWGSSVDPTSTVVKECAAKSIISGIDISGSISLRKSLSIAIESNQEQLFALAKQYKEKKLEIMALENEVVTLDREARVLNNSSLNLTRSQEPASQLLPHLNTLKVEVECKSDDLTSVKVTIPPLNRRHSTTMDALSKVPESAEIIAVFSSSRPLLSADPTPLAQSIIKTHISTQTVTDVEENSTKETISTTVVANEPAKQQEVTTLLRTCTDLTSLTHLPSGQTTHLPLFRKNTNPTAKESSFLLPHAHQEQVNCINLPFGENITAVEETTDNKIACHL